MTDLFSFREGETPLLVNIPHDGRQLAPGQAERMTDIGQALPDTDWYVRELYDFASQLGANVLAANYSRYVVDLNRPPSDDSLYVGQLSTGLCPIQTFTGQNIYKPGEEVRAEEQRERVITYWQPYHDKLSNSLDGLCEKFGYALLWDAHSIAGEVPLLFAGSLPDLNIGTNSDASCNHELAMEVASVAENSSYSAVVNGRFRGGYITRHYGAPDKGVNVIQLELNQRTYMRENSLSYDSNRALSLTGTIRSMLEAFEHTAKRCL